jgi:hypothetical protein
MDEDETIGRDDRIGGKDTMSGYKQREEEWEEDAREIMPSRASR